MPTPRRRRVRRSARRRAGRWTDCTSHHNLPLEHVGKAAARHRSSLEEPAPQGPERTRCPAAPQAPDLQQVRDRGRRRRVGESALAGPNTRQRDHLFGPCSLWQGIKLIMRETGLAKVPARRSDDAETDRRAAGQENTVAVQPPPSQLHLHQRWNEGVHQRHPVWHARAERTRIEGQLRHHPRLHAPVPARQKPPRPPSPAPPRSLPRETWPGGSPRPGTTSTTRTRASSAKARQRPPAPRDVLVGHVTEFAKILTGRHGDRLDDWITAAEADYEPDLHSFVRGIKRDYDAVLNGPTMPWVAQVSWKATSTGVKMLKRHNVRPALRFPCSESAYS